MSGSLAFRFILRNKNLAKQRECATSGDRARKGLLIFLLWPRHFEKIAFEGSFYCLLPWPCLQRRSLLFLGFLCHSLSHLLWAWEVYLFVSWCTLMHEALSKRAVLWGLIRCFLEPLLLTVGFWLSREQYISAHNVECVCTYVYMCVYLCVCVLMCACKVWVPVRMKGYFLVARKLLSVSIVHSTYF